MAGHIFWRQNQRGCGNGTKAATPGSVLRRKRPLQHLTPAKKGLTAGSGAPTSAALRLSFSSANRQTILYGITVFTQLMLWRKHQQKNGACYNITKPITKYKTTHIKLLISYRYRFCLLKYTTKISH
jgi:hypothetical protein